MGRKFGPAIHKKSKEPTSYDALPMSLRGVLWLERSTSKGLANGVGRPMMSFLDLLLPFIDPILARIELALRFRACPIVLEREAAVGAAKLEVKLEERLALRLGSAEVDLLVEGREVLK
jgi:hypothetical protein